MKKPEVPPAMDYQMFSQDIFMDFIRDNHIQQKLSEVEKDYPYWETFKHKVKNEKYSPEFLWNYTKLITRRKATTQIKVCDFAGFDFQYNTTSRILKYLHQFDLHLGGILEGGSIIPSEDKNRYLISSIMEEAIASSQLEGAATTREVAKEMLRTNRKPKTVSEKMIVNNYLTIKRVLELKNEKMSKEMLLDLHSIVSKGTLERAAAEGKFRENNDVKVVDGVTDEVFYIPPDHAAIEMLIKEFCEFANDNNNSNDFIHPIVKAIILHFLIGYIHPFVDGNGRTARAIFYWYLISKGYWLVEYMSISRIIIKSPAKYARAYLHSEYDENDLTYFIEYNLRAMDLALQELKKYIQRKIQEKQSLYKIIKNENVNERQAELLKALLVDNQKSLTIKEVQTRFAIVYQTARVDLLGLVEMGYLTEKKFGKKLVFFRVDDLEERLEKIAGRK